jgi:hypothetical protein
VKLLRRLAWLALLCTLAGAPVCAQCPPQTSVADTIYNADGSLAEGRVVIAWPTFQAGSCQVVAGQVSVPLVSGALAVPLYPNDAATPAGTSYRVTFHLKSGRITTEYWVVPSSATPVSLALVRSPSVPVPAVMVSQAQVTNLVADLARKVELPSPCPTGKFLQANGSVTPPQVSCVDGTGAPLASSAQSGTVKTDLNELDPLVYTKASTDGLLAGKAAASHSHSAADTTAGTFDPARIPAPTATTLGGVRSGACSGTDKMNGISTSGAIQCAADQTGGGGAGSQHQVNATNLAANDPINFQDSGSIAFSNPSAGNVQALLQDSAVSAAKLAVSSPSSAQLSGIDDDNIASAALSPNRIAGTAEVQSNKGIANGYASLNGSSLVTQNPASAQATPAASKIPLSDGAGKLDDAWLSSNVSLLGPSISLSNEVTGILPLANGGTNQSSWTPGRCVQVNAGGTALESAGAACGSGGSGGLGDPGANGIVVRTALDTTTARVITGTANRISVTNGDGVGGNPTLDIGSDVLTASHTVTRDFPLQCTNPKVSSGAGNAFFDVENLPAAGADLLLGKFNDAADGRVTCTGFVPNELAGTPAAKIIFDVQPHVACGSSQNFRVNIRYRFWGATTSDTAWTVETEQSIAGSTTAHSLTRATFPSSGSLANAPAAGDNVGIEIQRDGADASDTCAQVMELLPGSVKLRVDVKVKN